ncbi:MAG: hypothetical protein GY947_09200 [Rhodobacteraceae bacterium]|nr:hypothetical protein [Paracoccaceae bacterium]
MKRNMKILPVIALAFTLALPQVAAAKNVCFVDYKAKQTASGGLKLHYGVMKLKGPACSSVGLAEQAVAARISAGGWRLLTVLSKFDKTGLKQRRRNAGQYFLRY